MSYLGPGDDFPESISIEKIRIGVRFAGDNRVCASPFTALWLLFLCVAPPHKLGSKIEV